MCYFVAVTLYWILLILAQSCTYNVVIHVHHYASLLHTSPTAKLYKTLHFVHPCSGRLWIENFCPVFLEFDGRGGFYIFLEFQNVELYRVSNFSSHILFAISLKFFKTYWTRKTFVHFLFYRVKELFVIYFWAFQVFLEIFAILIVNDEFQLQSLPEKKYLTWFLQALYSHETVLLAHLNINIDVHIFSSNSSSSQIEIMPIIIFLGQKTVVNRWNILPKKNVLVCCLEWFVELPLYINKNWTCWSLILG